MKGILALLILGLLANSLESRANSRAERRYLLLKEDDHLRMTHGRDRFFNGSLSTSYELLSLFSHVYDVAKSSNTSANKDSSIQNLLNQKLGRSYFEQTSFGFGSPLPYIKIKRFRLLPGIFYQNDRSVSLGILPGPLVSAMIKKDQKVGLHSFVKYKKNAFEGSLYGLTRSESYTLRNMTAIRQREALFTSEDLVRHADYLMMDFQYTYLTKWVDYQLEFREIPLYKSFESENLIITARPLINLQSSVKLKWNDWTIIPYAGAFYRNYSLEQSLFLGSKFTKGIFTWEMDLSSSYMTLYPALKGHWWKASYSLKIPTASYEKENSPTQHQLELSLIFP